MTLNPDPNLLRPEAIVTIDEESGWRAHLDGTHGQYRGALREATRMIQARWRERRPPPSPFTLRRAERVGAGRDHLSVEIYLRDQLIAAVSLSPGSARFIVEQKGYSEWGVRVTPEELIRLPTATEEAKRMVTGMEQEPVSASPPRAQGVARTVRRITYLTPGDL